MRFTGSKGEVTHLDGGGCEPMKWGLRAREIISGVFWLANAPHNNVDALFFGVFWEDSAEIFFFI